LFFKSGEGFAVWGLHAKWGVGELAASLGADFIDRAEVVSKKRAGGMGYVVIVFGWVYFPKIAQFFIESLGFEMGLGVLGRGFEFSGD